MRHHPGCLALVVFLVSFDAHAARMGPGLPGYSGIFPVSLDGQRLLLLRIGLALGDDAPIPGPPGVLDGVASPNDAYLGCSWPAAPPDRDDRFGIQWNGYWQPGEVTCTLRLRANDSAVLYLNGERILECRDCPAGATRTVALDGRRHALRLDYHEVSGPAFVFLDWQIPGRAWNPIPAKSGKPNEEIEGWEGRYCLGETLDQPAFTRQDAAISFDWREEGPFDRPEDLPTLSLEWSHESGKCFGEVGANRDGPIQIQVMTPSVDTTPLFISTTPTEVSIVSHEGTEVVHFLLDQEVDGPRERVRVASLCEVLSPTGTCSSTFLVPVQTSHKVRFWEQGGAVESGSSVAGKVRQERESFERSRPRLAGALGPWDHALIPSGRWWCRTWIEQMEFGPVIPGAGGPAPISPGRRRMLAPIMAGLPSAVSSLLSLCAPDLRDLALPLWREMTPESCIAPFAASPTSELEFLSRCLSKSLTPPLLALPEQDKDHPGRTGPVFGHSRWKTTTLPQGLAEALNAFQPVRALLAHTRNGEMDVGSVHALAEQMGLENWRMGERLFDFRLSASGFDLLEQGGAFLHFDHAAKLSGFHVSSQGEWRAVVDLAARSSMETGPPEKVVGAQWDGSPLLMVKRADRLRAGALPSEKGKLKLLRGGQPGGIPRR
jgi:hypothetical protein